MNDLGPTPGASNESSHLVLVVDDVDDSRAMCTTALAEAGFRAVPASSGAEALELAMRLRPRVILMDLSMPVLDGWEATRRIRASVGAPHEMSIIALSAFTGERARIEAFRAGCDGFVSKPCTPDVIVSVVRAWLDAPPDT